ncbi:membrane protein insertase YidC [Desulfoplanes formicivorans]|uniref:Membrane protein insertase YidC n=1 Tax=Desulfoplanes formicivorans TaxID=1592317 RepID=A0A194AF07_9BACT|nr:membrane protein insertase YidC [Desulfoplanes formicivorans]GAU08652.1 membrane protein [Desulfoplanes formicivorans]
MDNRRVVLAVALSIGVLLIWNWLFPPVPNAPVPSSEPQQSQTAPVPAAPQAAPAQTSPETPVAAPAVTFIPTEGKSVVVNTPLYKAVLNTDGGILEHFVLKQYTETIAQDSPHIDLITSEALNRAPLGIRWNRMPVWSDGTWGFSGQDLTLNGQEKGTLTFTGKLGSVTFIRTLSFGADRYEIEETLEVVNTTPAQVMGELEFSMASTGLSSKDDRYNRNLVAYLSDLGLEEENDEDDLKAGLALPSGNGLKWAGIENNYFILALAPLSGDMGIKAKLEGDVYRLLVGQNLIIEPGQSQRLSCTYYLGPKKNSAMASAPNELKRSIHYGWFDIIAKPLIKGLNFLYTYVGNYGVAIIILTIIIKILFWPLSQKSYKSMEKMKKIQPLMAQVREKYKDDRDQMNKEVMRLYKAHKVNPAGGCLPMILQIPVFFALYQALLGAIELRHAPFIAHLPMTDLVWLADLSAKDPFYITPIIMGATMFLQQKMTPTAGDPTQAKIMLFMPIVFTFIFLNFPSGLVIYWMVNNILSIAQQWMIARKL